MQSTEGTTTHPTSIKKELQHLPTQGSSVNLQQSTWYGPQSTRYGPGRGTYSVGKDSQTISFWRKPSKAIPSHHPAVPRPDTGGPSFKQQRFSNPDAGSRRWHYWHPPRKKRAMPPKWCQRWAESILQRFWNTAWDILTHRNIEKGTQWAWPAPTIAIVLM